MVLADENMRRTYFITFFIDILHRRSRSAPVLFPNPFLFCSPFCSSFCSSFPSSRSSRLPVPLSRPFFPFPVPSSVPLLLPAFGPVFSPAISPASLSRFPVPSPASLSRPFSPAFSRFLPPVFSLPLSPSPLYPYTTNNNNRRSVSRLPGSPLLDQRFRPDPILFLHPLFVVVVVLLLVHPRLSLSPPG